MAVEAVNRTRGFEHIGLRDRVLVLRSLGPLAQLNHSALSLLAEHTRPRKWAKGDRVLSEGIPITEVQIVTEGVLRVTRKGKLVTDVGRGYGAGFLSVLARDPTGVDAVALEPTETLALPVSVLEDSLEQNFSFFRNGLRLTASSVLDLRGNLPTPEIVDDADPGPYPERSQTFVERVIEIRKNGVFASANVDAAVEFVRRSTEIRGKAGDVLSELGDHSDHWFSIQHGRFRCTNAEGTSTTVGADFILGVMEALAAEPRRYRIVAETDYVIHRTELETMLAIMEAHFELGMDLMASLSRLLLDIPNDSDSTESTESTESTDGSDS